MLQALLGGAAWVGIGSEVEYLNKNDQDPKKVKIGGLKLGT